MDLKKKKLTKLQFHHEANGDKLECSLKNRTHTNKKNNTHTPTCRTEEEKVRVTEMIEDLIGEKCLGISNGAKLASIINAQVILDVIKQQGKTSTT